MSIKALKRLGSSIIKSPAQRKTERYTQKTLKPQIKERQALNRSMRGGKVSPGDRASGSSYLARGKPKIKW